LEQSCLVGSAPGKNFDSIEEFSSSISLFDIPRMSTEIRNVINVPPNPLPYPLGVDEPVDTVIARCRMYKRLESCQGVRFLGIYT
jgi:hypothetical protein